MQISGHKTRRYNIVSEGNTPFFSACEQRGACRGRKPSVAGASGAQEVATVTTHALSIQNVGWRAARKLVGGRVLPARRKEIENELRRRVLEEFRATRIREPKKRFYVVEERRGGANP